MNYKEQTVALNSIPIRDIASWVGKSLPEQGSALCPFPDHPEKNKSFEVKRSKVRWQCYGCNRMGGAIDFVSVYFDFDFITAKKWLLSKSGLASSGSFSFPPQKKAATARPNVPITERVDFEVYEAFLEMSPLGKNGADYLGSRGLSMNLLDRFKIGQISSASYVAEKLVRKFGVARLIDAGLITSRSTPTNTRLTMPNQTIIIPFLERGRVAYIQGRAFGEVKAGRKWFNLPGRARRTFNVDELDAASSPLAICEGVSDTLSAEELGYRSIGILGVSDGLTVDEIQKMRGRDVILLLDWDAAGEKRAATLEAELLRHGIMVTRKSQPRTDVKDINQFLMMDRGLS